MTSPMTADIPHEMRQTVWVSLAAHLIVLSLLCAAPFVTMPPMGASTIQVLLVSTMTESTPPSVVPQTPPVEDSAAPVHPSLPQPARKHQSEAVPKRVLVPPSVAPAQPVTPAPKVLAEAPASPPLAIKPLPPASSVSPMPRMTDEINKLLSRLPSVPPVSPAPTVAHAPQGSATPHVAALESCPPQARTYCPLLERTINRAWNADHDPGLRTALESAVDATATIRMVILPDGVIQGIQISRSSGHDTYDRAVQSLLRELRHLPPLPAEMQGEPFVVRTTFTYSRKRE